MYNDAYNLLGAFVDLIRHPDLVEVSARIQAVFAAALQAEQIAAEVAHRRQRDLRDFILELEDRQAPVRVTTSSRRWPRGLIVGVGSDHLLMGSLSTPTLIRFDAIESIESE
jgi:hypothetical protein